MKVDYGLRVLIHLAQSPTPVPVSASEIADQQKIPEAYLHHVLRDLQAGGMLESRRGPSGGHMLAKPAKEITVADVFVTFDRSLAPLDCVDSPEECTLSGACSQRELWSDVERVLLERLSKTRVSDLVAEQREMVWAGAQSDA
jgi:Rrf2 family protein